jgi:hypothetical protein
VTRAYYGNGSDTPGLFEPECRAINKLCTLIFQNPHYRRTFAFDIGPLEALFGVCMICPKKEICEEAIRLLKLAKGRTEMLGNAETYAVRCKGILQMRFPA